ncbi:MAG: SusD/RagB family nutrient-binding outer membrane lipoprotein [Bacteroidota bacterium]
MRTILKYKFIAIVLMLLVFVSCEDFLDVNEHPNKQTTPVLSTLTSSCIVQAANVNYSLTYYGSRYAQHTSGVRGGQTDQYYENRMNSAWYRLYAVLLADLDELKKLATEKEAYHFLGVAQILNAAYLGAASDFWGSLPYSEAFKGNENLTPAFDTQEQIYAEVYNMLDAAIANLQKSDIKYDFNGDGFETDFDLLYDGDTEKWIKLAHAYKARFLNHWSNTGSFDAAAVKSAVNSSFSSSDDDADFYYNSMDYSPYYSIVLANNTGNVSIMFSDYIIQVLNGNIYGTGLDPRLAIIADTTGTDYNGVYTGQVAGSDDARDTDLTFTENCWHFGESSANQLVTYAETQFILAEIEINSGNKGTAFTAYENGLKANMEKLGVSSEDINTYIAETGVTADNISIGDVMKEKYIAMFLQYEAWNDIRRYDYGEGNDTYKNFPLPANINPEMGGKHIRRVLYPLTEENRNGVSANAAKGPDYGLLKPVVWNQ